MNGAAAALRFFFTTTCNRPEMARHLRLAKQPQKLPVVLTTDEVLRLLEAAPGPKYNSVTDSLFTDLSRSFGCPDHIRALASSVSWVPGGNI